jgi:antagonist of KipI
MMTIEVLAPGMLTTIQDCGRPGYRRFGIPAGGAMDTVSMRIANMLVGNAEDETALEVTLTGPVLRFQDDALIAICGPHCSPSIDGIPVPLWRPVLLRAGVELTVGSVRGRACIALAGGLDLPEVLGSRSTLLSAGIGGVQGEPLHEGDLLRQRLESDIHQLYPALEAQHERFATTRWYLPGDALLVHPAEPVIRLVRGPEFDMLTEGSRKRFFTEGFVISPESNRMGYRLSESGLELIEPLELLTEGVAPGTIQLPPNGAPIILMADCQTTGGYPRIASVIAVDLPRVGQLMPGDRLRFEEVSLEEAHRLFMQQEQLFREWQRGIDFQRLSMNFS